MPDDVLFQPLVLPCGAALKNRIAKSAMSDSLGDGCGDATEAQIRLYERWARGGLGLAIIGEVQGDPQTAEKPGNLVLGPHSNESMLRSLARRGQANGAALWLQLGHAGAMVFPPIGIPKGPSALDLPELTCKAISLSEIEALPESFAKTAQMAKELGFGGVQIHAAHGFLLSQFLSPLFNQRTDGYGGSLPNRLRLTVEVCSAVRRAVGPSFPIGIKINASDLLKGGLTETDSIEAIRRLNGSTVDLIDISGGTYFPGAQSASDSAGSGPYFLDFAQRARCVTNIPLMLTGGVKTREDARKTLATKSVDVIGLARALALKPELPEAWAAQQTQDVTFPRFKNPAEGAVTAWYTMRLKDLASGKEPKPERTADEALTSYNACDQKRIARWNAHFQSWGQNSK